mgnify:FL=1
MMLNYSERLSTLKIALDAYPTSLRLLNWIGYMSIHGGNFTAEQQDTLINSIYSQWLYLAKNIEYHLGGNHLLENYISLVAGAVFFQEQNMIYTNAKRLDRELKAQLCSDGGHVERSPMYHQLLLVRLLDLYNLSKSFSIDPLMKGLKPYIERMLAWLSNMTLSTGEIPLANDSFLGQAPTTQDILSYANAMGITPHTSRLTTPLSDSGYRLICQKELELFIDIGPVGPNEQPGHAHADTLQVLLWRKGVPILVDSGTSTYEPGPLRDFQRSTKAHNTVVIDDKDSSEVWGAFRVGRRAEAEILSESSSHITAAHNGYVGCAHERKVEWGQQSIIITDRVQASVGKKKVAYFHFHPDANAILLSESISFKGASEIVFSDYDYADHYGKTVPAKVLSVQFEDVLITTISL